jgi:hypothetical protein
LIRSSRLTELAAKEKAAKEAADKKAAEEDEEDETKMKSKSAAKLVTPRTKVS